MGVFQNAIFHEINQFEKNLGRKPKYLILSTEKEMLLVHECFHSENYVIEKNYDQQSGRKFKQFAGLEVVTVGIQYQGSIGWGLGD